MIIHTSIIINIKDEKMKKKSLSLVALTMCVTSTSIAKTPDAEDSLSDSVSSIGSGRVRPVPTFEQNAVQKTPEQLRLEALYAAVQEKSAEKRESEKRAGGRRRANLFGAQDR